MDLQVVDATLGQKEGYGTLKPPVQKSRAKGRSCSKTTYSQAHKGGFVRKLSLREAKRMARSKSTKKQLSSASLVKKKDTTVVAHSATVEGEHNGV